jgi:hypothetical protein
VSGLDKFFEKKPFWTHPKVEFWKSLLAQKKVELLRVEFVREKDGIIYGPASIFVHFCDAAMQDTMSPDEAAWDERINAELVKLHARAVSRDNECERFGMVFIDRFRRVETRFGDTFFSAALVTYLKNSAFAALSPSKEILAKIPSYKPFQGQQLSDCVDMIEEVIGYCIDSLHEALEYTQPITTQISSTALAYCLDDKFLISDKQLLDF